MREPLIFLFISARAGASIRIFVRTKNETAARMKRIVLSAAPIVGALLWSFPALADNYGAIAYSQSSGAVGWSYDYPSRKAAEGTALGNCQGHGGGCSVAFWFSNNCGALAASADRSIGWGWADNRFAAQARALDECRKHGRAGCQIRAWSCNTH